MKRAITLQNVSKSYPQKDGRIFHAVKPVTLEIPHGQIIGLLGPNGAGKTTTIKMMCDIISPTTGAITINGLLLSENRQAALSQLGAVLEGARNIYWQLTVWQNLMYFGRLKGIPLKKLQESAQHLLQTLELTAEKDMTVSELSRGTQQKIAIACALIADPAIILLDEPTIGLDLQSAANIKQWIYTLAHSFNKTVVLTTHNLDIAQQVCERLVIMHKGSVLADQPTNDLLKAVSAPHYQITVAGKIADAQTILPSLSIIENAEHTHLIGVVADQEMLHNQLSVIRALNLPLISVTRTGGKLEEVFTQLIRNEGAA